jgi:hypothetical protein
MPAGMEARRIHLLLLCTCNTVAIMAPSNGNVQDNVNVLAILPPEN